MKKLIYSLFALAMTAMTFTGCEDVPSPYDLPSDSDTTHVTPIAPTGTGTKDDPFNVAGALNYIASGDTDSVYVKGVIIGTPAIDTSYGNATYNISDNIEGTNQLVVYRGYYLGNKKFTSTDQIKEGDSVVVYGKLVNYGGTYEFTNRSYIYSLNGKTADGGNNGEPSGDGTKASPYNVAKAKSFGTGNLPADNVYIKGIVAKTGTVDSKYGDMTYYISDDGASANDLEIYHGLYLNGDKFTSADQLAQGDTVVVYGQITSYTGANGTTLEVQKSQLVSIIGHKTPDENSVTVAATDMGFEDKKPAGTFKLSDGTTLTFDKADGTTAPAYYAGSYAAVRLYAKNTLTITAGKKIASITITTTDPDSKKYNGNDQAYAQSGDKKITIDKVSDTQVAFSGLDAATIMIVNDFTGASGGVQLRIKSITITYAK
jgi:RPA family protein